MMIPLCKAYTTLLYRNLITKYGSKHINIALNNGRFQPRKFISNSTSTLEGSKPGERINLTYEKVSDADYGRGFEDDECMYPEQFDGLENVSLNKLISFRNSLDRVKREARNEREELFKLMSTKMTEAELRARNHQLSQLMERVLRERVNPKCRVALFGSAINGLWRDGSDLDVCVQIPNVTSRSATIRNLRRISNVLAPLSPSRVFENRFTAKIPILHWKRDYSKPNKLGNVDADGCDFECQDIPSIDISVNNELAVVNSSLVGSYVAFEPRVRELVLFLKVWARTRGINNRSEGTLSSFALSLMLIHFLQRCQPPVLPSLQDLAFSTNDPPNYVDGVDCRFATDRAKIAAELNFLTAGKCNTADNRALLTGFFRYFGWYHLHSQNRPVLIRSVDLSEFSPDAATLGEPCLHVDNPFEVGVDVANVAAHQRARITAELRKAYHLLRAGNSLLSLLT